MKTQLNKILFITSLLSSIAVFPITNLNRDNSKTQSLVARIGSCMSGKHLDITTTDKIENKIHGALNRIDTEGVQDCKNLNSSIEQNKCLKVLDVARAMINKAHENQLNRIACR